MDEECFVHRLPVSTEAMVPSPGFKHVSNFVLNNSLSLQLICSKKPFRLHLR